MGYTEESAADAAVLQVALCETELTWLHMEIQRLLTYMEDEAVKIWETAERLQESNPALALQVQFHRQMWSCFEKLHWQHFWAITKLEGFQHVDMVHFRHRTLVMVDDVVDDTAIDVEGIGETIAVGGEELDDLDPELLHAEDEAEIDEGVELMMYIAEDGP